MVGSGKSSAVKTLLVPVDRFARFAGRTTSLVCNPRPEGRIRPARRRARSHTGSALTGRADPPQPARRWPPHRRPRRAPDTRRTQMVAALAASVLHRELSPLEEAALGWVMETISEANERSTDTDRRRRSPRLADIGNVRTSPSRHTSTPRSRRDGPPLRHRQASRRSAARHVRRTLDRASRLVGQGSGHRPLRRPPRHRCPHRGHDCRHRLAPVTARGATVG